MEGSYDEYYETSHDCFDSDDEYLKYARESVADAFENDPDAYWNID